MSVAEFLSALTITILLLIVLRIFWKVIAIIVGILYVLGIVLIASLFSAILWAVFINGSADGWGLLWLYFFLAFFGVVIVYALIVMDAYFLLIDWIRSIFGIK